MRTLKPNSPLGIAYRQLLNFLQSDAELEVEVRLDNGGDFLYVKPVASEAVFKIKRWELEEEEEQSNKEGEG
jgi:hypothetical protein